MTSAHLDYAVRSPGQYFGLAEILSERREFGGAMRVGPLLHFLTRVHHPYRHNTILGRANNL